MITLSAVLVWILLGFSLAGLGVVVWLVWRGVKRGWETLNRVNEALGAAVEYLRSHQADVSALAVLAEQEAPEVNRKAGVASGVSAGPGSTIPWGPPPYPAQLRPRVVERDAGREEVVEVGGEDRDYIDEEKMEELAKMGYGHPDVEFRPKGREVEAE